MKNKGFTLIELLAVIVILAIIALIATPIILNIINDTRESSNERSMELYARAIQNAVAHYMMLNPNDTDVTFDDIEKYISYDGAEVSCNKKSIKENGSVLLDDCTINGEVGYSYGVSDGVSESAICTLTTETTDQYTAEVVTCGSEQFYVMSNDGTTIKALAKYNLSLTSPYSQDTSGAENFISFIETTPEDLSYEYWSEDAENLIYSYVNAYEIYLKNTLGMTTASATLMTYDQAIDLGFVEWGESPSDKPWAYSTDYWLATPNGIYENGLSHYAIAYDMLMFVGPMYSARGIRPVVTIATSELTN